jgi:hypothetical protein
MAHRFSMIRIPKGNDNVRARRRFVAGLLVLATTACLSSACKKELRCKTCGMRVDPSSNAWRSELVVEGHDVLFDTPRCALQAWRTGYVQATSIRVREYYDGQVRDGSEVRFVLGGDVHGPMGADLVPVAPKNVTKFIQDHAAERALRLDEVTLDVLRSVGSR